MTKKKQIDWRIVVAGLTALTIIESIALCNGIDGNLMMIVIGIIGLTIGIVMPNPIQK